MTTIYVGDPKTRLVKITERGIASPLTNRTYIWGDETGGVTLAVDLITHARDYPDELDVTVAARFAIREIAKWRKDQPFMIGKERVLEIVEAIEAELAKEDAPRAAP